MGALYVADLLLEPAREPVHGVALALERLFIRASTMVDGFESLARQFQARVPATA